MSEGVNPMPLGQKSVVVEISNSFAAVELIGGVLDVASQCSELLLFLLSQLHVRLLLQIVEHACEKFIGIVVSTGLNLAFHKLVEFVGNLDGDLGHDTAMIPDK